MIISCFGPAPKVKKGRKKPKPVEETRKTKKQTHELQPPSMTDTHPEICAYVLHDGTWRPRQHYTTHRSTVENFPSRDDWAMHQETLNSTHDHVKKTREDIAKLQESVSYLEEAWSGHTRKQEDCLAGVEKVHQHLEAEARKSDEREGMRYWRQRLIEMYAEGKKHGEDENMSKAQKEREEEQLCAIREEWEAEKREISKHRQQQQSTQQKAEDYVNELRTLREDLKIERREASKRYQLEARRKAEKEALERAMQRQRRLAEEEREMRAADEERIRGLADRIRQDRYYYYYGGSEREAQATSQRARFPYRTPEPSQRYRRPADGGVYPSPDEDLPWVEETVEEEFPIYHSIGRRERRRTTLRGTGRRPCRSRGY